MSKQQANKKSLSETMVNSIKKGDVLSLEKAFNKAISERVADRLEQKRKEVAGSFFNGLTKK